MQTGVRSNCNANGLVQLLSGWLPWVGQVPTPWVGQVLTPRVEIACRVLAACMSCEVLNVDDTGMQGASRSNVCYTAVLAHGTIAEDKTTRTGVRACRLRAA